MGTVYVIGSTNVDTVLTVERHPNVGETVTARDVRTMPGGKGANQAAAVALAGGSCVFVSRVGDDDNAERYRDHLRARGVDVSAVTTVSGPTGQATIVVDEDGENSIIVVPGANASLSVSDVEALRARMAPGDVVSVQLEVPRDVVRAALRLAREAGAIGIFNPSPFHDDIADLIDLADLIVVNEAEAAQLGIDDDRVVRTLGADGAVWGDARVSAPKVDAVDTAGAGDAFTGTLAASLSRGESHAQALREAVGAASRAVLRPGAQQWAQDEVSG